MLHTTTRSIYAILAVRVRGVLPLLVGRRDTVSVCARTVPDVGFDGAEAGGAVACARGGYVGGCGECGVEGAGCADG